MLTPARLLLTVLALAGVATGPRALAQQSDSRLAGIAEEQAQLRRQLQRLRLTMENLLPRLEQENRSLASNLVREGLKLLDERIEQSGSQTLEELMDAARKGASEGLAVQSLESQEAVILSLERLISILTDRESLERLEDSLEELRALRESLSGLSQRESQLEQATQALERDSQSAQERALGEQLAQLEREQRELLERTEALGRESGSFERGIASALLIGAFAGLLPAVRASRLPPTVALRTV